MTNLLKLDQLLILSVISALKLNRRSTTAWTNKSYYLKQNFQVYGNIIQKSLKNGVLRTWSVLGLPELCTIFSFMKENQRQIMEMTTLIMTIYKNQHKLLSEYHKNHKLLFDNWFSTLELMLYLKNKEIFAVGTIRLNRLSGCSVSSNKDLQKAGRGSSDYRTDKNSGIIVVKWVDNNVVQLISNFVGIEPMISIERWCKKEKKRKDIPCP